MADAPKTSSWIVTDSRVSSGLPSPPVEKSDHSFEKPKPHRTHTHHSVDLDTYFKGPRDIYRHSRWPFFLRLHGSAVPKLIVPLIVVGAWSTTITCISKLVYPLGINSVLLTVLGFVVGLALSFRSSTAYERYSEGVKYWSQLSAESRILSRFIWISTAERHKPDPAVGKFDLLAKLTAMNLIKAFSVALKHRLRFEPAAEYPDLQTLVSHFETFAGSADQTPLRPHPQTSWHEAGQYLGIPSAISNPRKLLKRSQQNLGNLPLEILHYLSAYMQMLVDSHLVESNAYQAQSLNSINNMINILNGTERIINTPLPLAYAISIAQITWVYVLMLPFQLFSTLGWITIPATMVAAYIILGLAAIGREIENPFGDDVNDLPLDAYCRELAADIDLLVSRPRPLAEDFISVAHNRLLWPLSLDGYTDWSSKSVPEIRDALKAKAVTGVALKVPITASAGIENDAPVQTMSV